MQKEEQDPATKKEMTGYIVGLLDRLDKEKAKVSQLPGYANGAAYVEEKATMIFDVADAQDRTGNATKETATNFYVAQTLFESLKLFGPLSHSVEERAKYAKWKAVEITKALKSGVKPQPGPPPTAAASIPPQTNTPVGAPAPFIATTPYSAPIAATTPYSAPIAAAAPYLAPAPAPAPASAPKPAPVVPAAAHAQASTQQRAAALAAVQATAGVTTAGVDTAAITEAQRFARFAVSALQFEDVPTAVKNLRLALQTLGEQ
eukprot:TRINITY_DN2728_c0_g1_i1.p1 TRINITY_DN2728_c0_g1~~TRINITY_DN2728_c0_g1_i1.p1  ORF type:complete len:303 (-),score=76.92 TRINITY_DN2728_c0_g1_i1:9-791(-)